MATFPATVTEPEVLTRAPPFNVRLPFTVRAFVPLPSDPALKVRLDAVSCESWLRVPETESAAKDWPAASLTVLEPPVKVTLDAVAVKVPAEEVSHEPPRLIVADAKAIVAAPDDAKFPLNTGVEELSVRVPEKVRSPLKEVEMPVFTVRLFTVWGTLTLPPDAFTTTVEVAATKEPRLESMDLTVIVEPFAARVPPPATIKEVAAMGRFKADVDNAVVPVPPCTVSAFATRRPFVAMVKVTVLAPLLNVTL